RRREGVRNSFFRGANQAERDQLIRRRLMDAEVSFTAAEDAKTIDHRGGEPSAEAESDAAADKVAVRQSVERQIVREVNLAVVASAARGGHSVLNRENGSLAAPFGDIKEFSAAGGASSDALAVPFIGAVAVRPRTVEVVLRAG